MERRIYEIARKHCGDQELFKIGLEKLQLKVGSSSALWEFRRSIREIVTNNHLPDYEIALSDDDHGDLHQQSEETSTPLFRQTGFILLKPETYEKAQASRSGVGCLRLGAAMAGMDCQKERTAQAARFRFHRILSEKSVLSLMPNCRTTS